MLFLIIISVLMVVLIVDHMNRKRINRPMENIPYLPYRKFPLIGEAYKFFGSDEDRMMVFQQLGRDATDHGAGFVRFTFGRRLFVVVTDPEIAECLLRTYMEKDDLMEFMRVMTGNGTIFAPVSIWRPRRKQIVHAFSPKMLQQFAEVFIQGSEELVHHLMKNADKGAFSVWKYLTNYTMDAVCITNLGVNVGAQKNNDTPFCQAFEHVLTTLGDRICQPWLHVDAIYRMFPQRRSMLKALATCDNFINSIIRKRRAEMEGNPLEGEKQNEHKSVRATVPMKTFMEILMEGVGEGGLDDEALRDECTVIAAAGTDTSAVGACFTLSQLARHPEVQEKVFQEVKEIFGESGQSLTREDLGKLHYTDAVVRETLRLYPPVPVIVRRVDRTVTLPSGHSLVPGTGILVHIWMLHRNPKYWGPDAEIFRPERFLDKELPHPAAFIPFSHGPRNCLGYQYAMMSMKTAIAHVIRKFRVLPATSKCDPNTPHREPKENPMRLKFDIMMKDVDYFPLQLEIREK